MRVLLDNFIPRRIGRLLGEHEVRHASEMGFAELSNGKLLSAAATAGFDVVLTVDRNMPAQQNLGELPIPIVVLLAKGNREDLITPLLAEARSLLDQRLQRKVYRVG